MKHNYKPLLLVATLTASGLFSACEKQDNEPIKPLSEVTSKRQLSAEEQVKTDNYQQAALVLLKLLHDDKQLLKAISKEVKVDKQQHEQVAFKDLFDAAKTASNGHDNLFGNFKAQFDQALSAGQYPRAERFAKKPKTAARGANEATELEAALLREGTDIYFPYSEYFGEVTNPTITYAPLDNTEQSTGFYYADTNGDGTEEVVEVMVDENYVQKHPTFIVQPLDEVEKAGLAQTGTGNGTLGTQGIQALDTINQILIGYVQLTEQRDPLFSDGSNNAGGSELRFVRPKGFLGIDASGQVNVATQPAALVGVDLSRATITDKNHTYQYITFDSDWERTESTQYFCVYEEDNASERKDAGSVVFAASAGATLPGTNGGPGGTTSTSTTRTMSYEITYKTKEQILWQQDFNRADFFYLNSIDQFNDWRGGFPFWRAQSFLKFTIPRRELIYER